MLSITHDAYLLHMVLHKRDWHSTYGTYITHMVTSITHAITHERIYSTQEPVLHM